MKMKMPKNGPKLEMVLPYNFNSNILAHTNHDKILKVSAICLLVVKVKWSLRFSLLPKITTFL
jgi:hypothetical protein